MNCSIIIPVYGQANLTRQCLDVLLSERYSAVEPEIVVVDDASGGEMPEMLAKYGERIRVLRHETNLGFATSCNDGAAAALGETLVFLNNDTIPQPGWLDALLAYAEENPSAGVVGAKLLFPDDTIQHAGVVIDQYGYPKHIYAGFPAAHPAVCRSRPYQAVTAACALIRRALFDDLSGFDTAFHNSYEDVDLCLRARAGGAEVHYCAESVLYHLESMSEGRFAHSAENERVFAERWVRTVERDDFRYYTEDELIGVSYENPYPLRITLSPALGTIEGSEAERRADHLLALRSRRSFEMTKEIARLNAQLLVNGKASVRRPSVQLLSAGSARWLSENPKHPRTWVLLPVRNAADRMRELLPRLYSQDAAEVVAVVAIDCGSTDDTVAVLQEFDVTILSAEGSSPAEVPLQECLLRARGEITTYEREEAAIVLGPAAIPADERWLASLLEPFDDADVAATCSRLLPANDADPLTRRRLLEATSAAEGGSIVDPGLFHGVSSAFRLDVLARFPLASGTTAAVHRWAETVLSKGQMLRHAPFSVACIESLPVIDLVAQGIAEANGNGAAADPVDLFAAVFELVREDWRHLERDLQLKGTELEHQRLDVALRRLAEAIGSRGGFGGTRSEHLWITDAAAERRAFGDWAEDA